ncbi:MAG: LysM peptidoglycan-binding domain-containing protein [Alphaproteobacteria bacterium]|nr:LysM peptidoglycan-binding domain-containing protein [Alphaproteobacteria bacterium]
MANNNTVVMGKLKRSTDLLIDDAIAKQNSWMSRRRNFTRRFLKSVNVFHGKDTTGNNESKKSDDKTDKKRSLIRAYWFPILCALIVLFVAIWVIFIRVNNPKSIVLIADANKTEIAEQQKPEKRNVVPRPVNVPTFDIVRIKKDGMIVVAGRWLPNKTISVLLNNKIVATEQTDKNGEFVYSPKNELKPGNYTLALIGVEPKIKSTDKVFLYISDQGFKNSVSLLMTPNGSKVLQAPKTLADGDLYVSKIDYLDTGRIVVTGTALPRLRVSLSLNDEYIGFARVSDYKNFGLGADVGELKPGTEYSLAVRLHDTDGTTVATINHKFVMPEMTGDNDTFYTVRRGDCLWIIARNFLRRGILFSIIAERNNIENPDLIFPKQLLQIPTKQ